LNRNKYFQAIFLFVLTIITFFVHLGAFEPGLMEARNFVTAREMLENQQWLLPTMNGLPRLEKPPFPTWFSAFTMSLFGESHFWLRLPAALMGCLMVYYTYRFALLLFGNKQEAVISVVALVTIPMVIQMGRTGSWDIFCQAITLAAIYHLFRFLMDENRPFLQILLAALYTGFSAMSKGPVGIYAMLLPFLIAYFITFGFHRLKGEWSWVAGYTLVSLAIASWWYLYAKATAPEMSDAVAEKEINAWVNRHTQPFYFYFPFPFFTGIWAIIIISSFFVKHYKKRLKKGRHFLFLFLWVVSGVALLSLIPEKKERYLLPVYPPIALLVGQVLAYLSRTPITERSKTERITATLFHLFLILILFSLPLIVYFVALKPGFISGFIWVLYLAILSFLVIQAYKNYKGNHLMRQVSVIGVTFALSILFLYPALPKIYYDNPGFKDIGEIRSENWYDEYDFYTDFRINPKK